MTHMVQRLAEILGISEPVASTVLSSLPPGRPDLRYAVNVELSYESLVEILGLDVQDDDGGDEADSAFLWSEASPAELAYSIINEDIIPEAIEFFKSKQRDYRGGPAFMLLGVKGQFADINRKYWKLYQALWEDQRLEGEQPEEILMDFIGHCLLTIYALRNEQDNT